MCVREGERERESVCERVCVSVCVRERECLCVCAIERERERERERARERVCVYVCDSYGFSAERGTLILCPGYPVRNRYPLNCERSKEGFSEPTPRSVFKLFFFNRSAFNLLRVSIFY